MRELGSKHRLEDGDAATEFENVRLCKKLKSDVARGGHDQVPLLAPLEREVSAVGCSIHDDETLTKPSTLARVTRSSDNGAVPLTHTNLELFIASTASPTMQKSSAEFMKNTGGSCDTKLHLKRKGDHASPPPKRAKRTSSSLTSRESFPWLRSGRCFAHPLVHEAATIQVNSLSEFTLAPPVDDEPTEQELSSQTTITDPSLPATPAESHPRPDSPMSSDAHSSQASTIAPWTRYRPNRSESSLAHSSQSSTIAPRTPPRPTRSVSPLAHNSQASIIATCTPPPPSRSATRRYRYVGSQPVPTWFAEPFESDGYDSEAIALIATPPRTPDSAATPRPSARRLAISSTSSSPSVTLISDTALLSAQDEWRREAWPSNVKYIGAHYNPENWKFEAVSVGVRGGLGCGCELRCRASTCLNARSGRFCTEYNCSFVGNCGNALRESPALSISRNVRTGMRGLTADSAIPAGEIIGQYFGHLQLFGHACKNGRINEGYRMRLKTKTASNRYVGIDALEAGGKLRLMNHSCKPSARFHEVQTGRKLTVVAVTIRDVYPGEEVTVSYGDKLWFVCRCGWWGCQHRDLQHLPAPPTHG